MIVDIIIVAPISNMLNNDTVLALRYLNDSTIKIAAITSHNIIPLIYGLSSVEGLNVLLPFYSIIL